MLLNPTFLLVCSLYGRVAKHSTTRRRLLSATGVALPIALAGCTSDNSGEETQGTAGGTDTSGTDGGTSGTATATGEILNVAQHLQPTRFDPITAYSNPDALIGNRIFSKLYTYDEGTNTVPNVASGDPQITNDNKRWTIPIRDDVTFHNGDPLTAEDVAYSFQAPLDEETGLSAVFKVIDSIEVVDETTVQFDLKFPYAMFDDVLTHHIVPKAVRKEDKEAFNTQNPVGSGPFKFVEWKEGEHVTLERWEDYWGETKPKLGGVEFSPVTESTTRVTTLQTGKQDVIEVVPPKLWNTVDGMDEAHIDAVESIGYFYAAFNLNEGPTTDIDVRQAIDHSFSMDDAVQQFIEPAGVRQYSPMPGPLVEDWGFPVDQWKSIPNDKNIDEAKSLLDGANVPSDWSCTIIVPPDDNRENIGVSIANGIKETGYEATVERYDWGPFLEKAYTGKASDFNIYILGWVRYPDPDDFMYNLFHEESETVYQGHFYKNDEVMNQISQARQSVDQAERKELYTNVITTILEDKVHLPSFNYKNSFGVRSRVKDFKSHAISPINPRLVTGYNNVTIGE